MREAYLVNNSQTSVKIPLYEKAEVPVVPVKIPEKYELLPGGELVLGVDIDAARLRYYEQFKSVQVALAFRDPSEVPASEAVSGVATAILHDVRRNVLDSDIITDYKVTAKKYQDKNYVTVSVEGISLNEHTNGSGKKGYWIGFAVTAPEGATQVKTGFAQGQNDLELGDVKAVELNINSQGESGVAFYSDLGQEIPKVWARVAWINDNNEAIGEVVDYYMNLEKVTLAPKVLTVANSTVKVGNEYFATLKAALDSAENGSTLTLLKDISLTETVNIPEDKKFNLNLAGKSLTGSVPGAPFIVNNGTLVVIDTEGTGVVQRTDNGMVGEASGYVIENFGTLTVNGGKIYNNSGYDKENSAGKKVGASLIRNAGVMYLAGGEFHQDNFIAIKNEGTLEVSGGTFTSNESAIQNWRDVLIKNGTINGKVWTDAYNAMIGKTVIIGGTVKGDVVMDYTGGDAVSTLQISGGIFDVEWDIRNAEKFVIAITGGSFTKAVPDTYCAEGYTPAQNEDGTYTVKVKEEE